VIQPALDLAAPCIGGLAIRPARRQDLPALVGVLADEQFVEDRFARQEREAGVLVTVWLGDEPLGGMYVWLEDADEAQLRENLPGVPLFNHIEVRAGHRCRGVGTTLIEWAENFLRDRGYDRVALAVEVTNVRAEKLYSRLGYREWRYPTVTCYAQEIIDGKVKERAETCRIMVKRLAGS
jgi:GNAT superfamily N-acetyltransferase